jgi:hypothetical protein
VVVVIAVVAVVVVIAVVAVVLRRVGQLVAFLLSFAVAPSP